MSSDQLVAIWNVIVWVQLGLYDWIKPSNAWPHTAASAMRIRAGLSRKVQLDPHDYILRLTCLGLEYYDFGWGLPLFAQQLHLFAAIVLGLSKQHNRHPLSLWLLNAVSTANLWPLAWTRNNPFFLYLFYSFTEWYLVLIVILEIAVDILKFHCTLYFSLLLIVMVLAVKEAWYV